MTTYNEPPLLDTLDLRSVELTRDEFVRLSKVDPELLLNLMYNSTRQNAAPYEILHSVPNGRFLTKYCDLVSTMLQSNVMSDYPNTKTLTNQMTIKDTYDNEMRTDNESRTSFDLVLEKNSADLSITDVKTELGSYLNANAFLDNDRISKVINVLKSNVSRKIKVSTEDAAEMEFGVFYMTNKTGTLMPQKVSDFTNSSIYLKRFTRHEGVVLLLDKLVKVLETITFKSFSEKDRRRIHETFAIPVMYALYRDNNMGYDVNITSQMKMHESGYSYHDTHKEPLRYVVDDALGDDIGYFFNVSVNDIRSFRDRQISKDGEMFEHATDEFMMAYSTIPPINVRDEFTPIIGDSTTLLNIIKSLSISNSTIPLKYYDIQSSRIRSLVEFMHKVYKFVPEFTEKLNASSVESTPLSPTRRVPKQTPKPVTIDVHSLTINGIGRRA